MEAGQRLVSDQTRNFVIADIQVSSDPGQKRKKIFSIITNFYKIREKHSESTDFCDFNLVCVYPHVEKSHTCSENSVCVCVYMVT